MALDETAIERSLGELRTLLAADGADLILVATDATVGSVTLRLMLESSDCADCVVPAPLIADIAQAAFDKANAGVSTVVVDDPRDERRD